MISALCAAPRMRAKAYISALPELINRGTREEAYKIYIAHGIRMATENIAKLCGGEYLTARYEDVVNPKPKDTRTGAEIAADVIKRAGLVVKTE